MNCEQAAEFVSVLFDCERIPHEAAEHIGSCAQCTAQLQEYAVVAAELRRVASVSVPLAANWGAWKKIQQQKEAWWKNWRSSMRIPKFAFALMIGAIFVLLAGSFAVIRARAGNKGAAILLSVKLPRFDHVHECALSLDEAHKGEPCAFGSSSAKVPGLLFMNIQFIKKEGERIELASKIKYIERPDPTKKYEMGELDALSETNVWISPGEPTQIQVAGLGTIGLSYVFLERMPIFPYRPLDALEPQEDEFRIVSPVLIRDKQVVFNMRGSTAIASGNSKPSVMLYSPGVGRLVLSGGSFAGAIEAKVKINQIEFNDNGHTYLLVNGMPVTRSEHVWILHEPNFRPSISMPGVSDDQWLSTSGALTDLLGIGKQPR